MSYFDQPDFYLLFYLFFPPPVQAPGPSYPRIGLPGRGGTHGREPSAKLGAANKRGGGFTDLVAIRRQRGAAWPRNGGCTCLNIAIHVPVELGPAGARVSSQPREERRVSPGRGVLWHLGEGTLVPLGRTRRWRLGVAEKPGDAGAWLCHSAPSPCPAAPGGVLPLKTLPKGAWTSALGAEPGARRLGRLRTCWKNHWGKANAAPSVSSGADRAGEVVAEARRCLRARVSRGINPVLPGVPALGKTPRQQQNSIANWEPGRGKSWVKAGLARDGVWPGVVVRGRACVPGSPPRAWTGVGDPGIREPGCSVAPGCQAFPASSRRRWVSCPAWLSATRCPGSWVLDTGSDGASIANLPWLGAAVLPTRRQRAAGKT